MGYPKNTFVFLLVLLFFTSVKNSLLGQRITSHKNTVQPFSLSALSYFQTNNKNESIKSIVGSYRTGLFKPVQSNVLNGGIPNQYYWIHFFIYNTSDAVNSLMIDITNSRLNEMELFELSGDKLISLGKLGDFYRFSQRRISHKNYIYPDTLPAGYKKEYFLFVNQVGNTFTLPVKLFTAESFEAATFKDYLFNDATYGILLFVGLLSFFFFLNSRHFLYLYYSLYLLTAILWFLSYFGFGYEYIWGNYPFMNTAMAPSMASLNIYLNLQICQILLKLSRTNKLLNILAVYTKYVLLFLAIFPFLINLNNYGYQLNHAYLVFFLISILFAMIIVSTSVIIYSLQGILTARFYLISSLLKAGSIVNLALLELGITPAVINMEAFLQVGIFIEITLLTYALSLRYSRFKSKTFIRVIEAHENERAIISKEIHDGISSSLTGINYSIKNFTKNIAGITNEKKHQLEKIFDELSKVQVEARHISHNTMPDYIIDNSITFIVEKYIAELQERIKSNAENDDCIKINFSYNAQQSYFSQPVKLNIFRIVQELINNILKHAAATKADVLFSFTRKDVLILTEDNGVGIIHSGDAHKDGMGLNNIRTRVELLYGDIEIKSPVYKHDTKESSTRNIYNNSGYGTLIKIRIPYKNNTNNAKADYEY